jgi:hypothetical protein
VHPDPSLLNDVVIVPAFSEFSITTAAVPSLDVSEEIKGKLEVELLYGPKPDDLRYVLEYELEPRVDIRELTAKNAQILFTVPVKKYRHKKGITHVPGQMPQP